MLLPAHYYLVRRHEDPVNEQYAWRMFSDTHHGMSFVEWTQWHNATLSESLPLLPHTNGTLGLSPKWIRYVTGNYRSYKKAPPLWAMDYIGPYLCNALPKKPHAISALHIRVPWEGEMVKETYAWSCA